MSKTRSQKGAAKRIMKCGTCGKEYELVTSWPRRCSCGGTVTCQSQEPEIIKLKELRETAKESLADPASFSDQRGWRGVVREHHLARGVLALDHENKLLRKALIKACALIEDSVQVIDEAGIVNPEDGESEDILRQVKTMHQLAKRTQLEYP